MSNLRRFVAGLYRSSQDDGAADAKTERHHRPRAAPTDTGNDPRVRHREPRDSTRKAIGGGPAGRLDSRSLPEPPSIGRIASAWQRHVADEAWPRPSLVADYGLIGPMTIAAASAIGRGHSHRQLQRQDAYGFRLLDDAVLCAIADGASSAPLSGSAADIAVSAALTAASTAAAARQDLVRRLEFAASVASDAVFEFGRNLLSRDADIAGQCASTLILCAARPASRRGDMLATLASVGDSSVLEITADKTIKVIVGSPQNTPSHRLRDYLPKPDMTILTCECLIPPGSTLLLATDGLARDLHSSPTVRDWFIAGLRNAKTTIDAAHVLSYTRHGSSDDLTFVAIRPDAD